MANTMSLVEIDQASVGIQHVQWFQFEERHNSVKFYVYAGPAELLWKWGDWIVTQSGGTENTFFSVTL